ncbi:MAG: T9SS type A sorting domain-containing protein [Fidelibacterota bacterium]|nr:MAG: T9SS type A sorting domain-containing protein [Candidatus Neomarinimicrobiota bacterium]
MTRQALVALLVSLGAATLTAQPSAIIVTSDGSTVLALGDTVTFQIIINPRGESLTGFEFYLTIDPAVLKPLLLADQINDTTIIYKPFTKGDLPGGMHHNHTHGDEWSEPYVDLNGLSGFQLDYSQQTGVTNPTTGERETFNWSGTGATFQAVVIGLPSDPSGQTIITFDRGATHYMEQRVNRYWPEVGSGINLATTDGVFDIGGVRISPALPDTILAPGDTWSEYLPDHFASSLYVDGAWSIIPEYTPGDPNAYIDPADTSLVVTSSSSAHDSVTFTIRLEETVADGVLYFDEQRIRVIVDKPPVFTTPLPAQPFTYNEDDSLQLVYSDIFTDADDGGASISVRLEPSSPIRVNYNSGVGTITFSADTNYFSVAPYDSARLFITDGLGVSIDSLIKFTVNSINDPPVVSFDSVSALGDTLVLHRATPDTLDLNLFASDVDDVSLAWSYTDPYPDSLSVVLLQDSLLRLEAGPTCPFTDIPLVITATDDSSDSKSDTLVVSVRPWPPDIIIVEDIKINSLDAPAKHLDLADWVYDPDTQPANMTWSFQAVDAVTEAVDPYVTFAPSSVLTGDTVNISITQAYAAVDLLEMTVTDDAGYSDTDTARLFIFDGDAPMIFPLPGFTIYKDTTYEGILDLDDYVADLQDNPAAISWTSFGDDSLASFSIDFYTHEITITTNTTFIGNLTVSLVATNSRGLKDTSDLAILVSRRYDGPPLWYAVPDEVEVVYDSTTYLFTYGEICYDETPTDSIDFDSHCDTTLLTVTDGPLDMVELTTPILVKDSTTYLYFSAEDELGQTSNSDTITVRIKDSFSPVWRRIPTISLNVGETYSGLFLRSYVDDRDTDSSLITIEVLNLNPFITVFCDPVTAELTVSAGNRTSDSWLIITATDDKGNTANALAHVIVSSVADFTPPVGGLTYFFNPAAAADRWIHYVVSADSTTDTTRFTWHYSYGSPPKDYSSSLSFAMKDPLPGTITWVAPYHFLKEGSYALTVIITDAANNPIDPSPSLLLAIGFSKATGGVLASPDQQLTVNYPPARIPNGKLLIISEDSQSVLTEQTTAELAGAGANKKATSQAPAKVYSLDTNLPEPILATLTYHQKRDANPYYSFYEVKEDQLVKIETYTSVDGHFEAAATLNRDIVFAPSDTPARNTPLPNAELSCYPNPFNATIQVRFLLRLPDQGRIVIYDLLGREIYASPRQLLEPGVHTFSWHSIDKRGLPASSGLYFIRLETDGGNIVTRKVTLLK